MPSWAHIERFAQDGGANGDAGAGTAPTAGSRAVPAAKGSEPDHDLVGDAWRSMCGIGTFDPGIAAEIAALERASQEEEEEEEVLELDAAKPLHASCGHGPAPGVAVDFKPNGDRGSSKPEAAGGPKLPATPSSTPQHFDLTAGVAVAVKPDSARESLNVGAATGPQLPKTPPASAEHFDLTTADRAELAVDPLYCRLEARLLDEGLALDDLPDDKAGELTVLLKEFGFSSAVERTKLKRAIKDRWAWSLGVAD